MTGKTPNIKMNRHGHDRMIVGFTTTIQSVPITTNVVSSNPIKSTAAI